MDPSGYGVESSIGSCLLQWAKQEMMAAGTRLIGRKLKLSGGQVERTQSKVPLGTNQCMKQKMNCQQERYILIRHSLSGQS